MSRIVLGLATSHSPLLANEAAMWLERAADDRRNPGLNLSDGRRVSYDTLLAERGPRYADRVTLSHLLNQARAANAALDRLAAQWRAQRPDVAVIIGDDQRELFGAANVPALALYTGPNVRMHPFPITEASPQWLRQAIKGYGMDGDARSYPGAPDIALSLVEGLMEEGIDAAVCSEVADPAVAGFGHAFGFVVERLFAEHPAPIVPLLLNTYYPPNVPRPNRCYEIGKALRRSIASHSGCERVAIIASGGLSHFVTDEVLDRRVLDALAKGDEQALRTLPMAALKDGSSEILCWVLAAGALTPLPHRWTEYIPVYRTPAGSGIGLGFAGWYD